MILGSCYAEVLRSIETRLPVSDWLVDGCRVWPLIRIAAYMQACIPDPPANRRLGRVLARARNAARIFGTALGARLLDRRMEQDPNQPVDMLFLSNLPDLKRSTPPAWSDRFCDPWRERLALTGLRHGMLMVGEARWPRLFPSHHISTGLLLRSLLSGSAPAANCQLPGFDEVAGLLSHSTGFALRREWLASQMRRIRIWSGRFGRILDRARPRAVAIVNYYSSVGGAMCLACWERSIPSIDLQHGLQGPLHPAYGGFHAVPPAGWDLLPQRFWVWGAEEAEAIDAWGSRCGMRHRAEIIGNHLLDLTLAGRDGETEWALARLRASKPARSCILITLQPSFDSPDYYELLSRTIAALPDGHGAWIRVHPIMQRDLETIRRRFASVRARIEIELASTLPLYAVLQESIAHLTHSSSVVLEADSFGLASVVFAQQGAELFPELARRGRLRLETEAWMIVQALLSPELSREPLHIASAVARLDRVGAILSDLLGTEGDQ